MILLILKESCLIGLVMSLVKQLILYDVVT